MKVKIKVEKEVEIRFLQASIGVRYWEDGFVNGVEEDNDNPTIPCVEDERWELMIDIDSGKILNWTEGVKAHVHYKVCDDGVYKVLDENNEVVTEVDGYVPDTLAIGDEGYGDYVILKINEEGIIEDWRFNFNDFTKDDEE